MDELVVCKERYGSQDVKKVYVQRSDNSVVAIDQSRRFTSATSFLKVSHSQYYYFRILSISVDV